MRLQASRALEAPDRRFAVPLVFMLGVGCLVDLPGATRALVLEQLFVRQDPGLLVLVELDIASNDRVASELAVRGEVVMPLGRFPTEEAFPTYSVGSCGGSLATEARRTRVARAEKGMATSPLTSLTA